jgi:hypothetical protein
MHRDQVMGYYDKLACLECTGTGQTAVLSLWNLHEVCPVGEDRLLYSEKGIRKSICGKRRRWRLIPMIPAYASWTHIRKWGNIRDVLTTGKKNKQSEMKQEKRGMI